MFQKKKKGERKKGKVELYNLIFSLLPTLFQ